MGGFLAALAPFAGPIGAIGGALIGARANKRAADKANELQDPVYMRKRLEAAGLNPAVHYGSMASRQIAVAQPGSLIANGFAAAADILQTDKSLEIQRTRLEQENERLNREVTRLTLNPKVPGVYGNGRPKVSSEDLPRTDGAGVPFGSTGASIASGREVEVSPFTSGPGFTEIHNDFTGPMIVPGADGEPWGIDETATYIASVPFNYAYRAGSFLRGLVDQHRTRRKMSGIYQDVKEAEKPKRPKARPHGRTVKERRQSKEYQDFMKKHYPTPFD